MEEIGPYIIVSERYWLAHNTLQQCY